MNHRCAALYFQYSSLLLFTFYLLPSTIYQLPVLPYSKPKGNRPIRRIAIALFLRFDRVVNATRTDLCNQFNQLPGYAPLYTYPGQTLILYIVIPYAGDSLETIAQNCIDFENFWEGYG